MLLNCTDIAYVTKLYFTIRYMIQNVNCGYRELLWRKRYMYMIDNK